MWMLWVRRALNPILNFALRRDDNHIKVILEAVIELHGVYYRLGLSEGELSRCNLYHTHTGSSVLSAFLALWLRCQFYSCLLPCMPGFRWLGGKCMRDDER